MGINFTLKLRLSTNCSGGQKATKFVATNLLEKDVDGAINVNKLYTSHGNWIQLGSLGARPGAHYFVYHLGIIAILWELHGPVALADGLSVSSCRARRPSTHQRQGLWTGQWWLAHMPGTLRRLEGVSSQGSRYSCPRKLLHLRSTWNSCILLHHVPMVAAFPVNKSYPLICVTRSLSLNCTVMSLLYSMWPPQVTGFESKKNNDGKFGLQLHQILVQCFVVVFYLAAGDNGHLITVEAANKVSICARSMFYMYTHAYTHNVHTHIHT